MQKILFPPMDDSKGRAAALISLTGSLFYSSGMYFNFFFFFLRQKERIAFCGILLCYANFLAVSI